ncbi:MAG: DUF1592 domain-containing protein, partial [Planctomycetota bacterium]
VEKSADPKPEPLSPHEFVAKLSYFLWNSTPDDALTELATNGALERPESFAPLVSAEVDRLVADKKFQQFTEEFVSQWLSLDKFDVVSVSGKYPRLNRETRRQLREEPIHFVTHLLRENLPLHQLIDTDFILANDVVAGYYGLGDRAEHGYKFAPIQHGSKNMGGVLTQVAVLTGLSDGNESNPVKRGAWLARKIVAEPPAPPPPNVPDLPRNREAKTLRERLQQHRDQEGCAECHQKIDPWGLPLEEFDAGGIFKKEKVDASSTLPDGTDIAGTKALKQYLTHERIDQVAFSFLMHLSSYATGRSLTFSELEFLKREGRRVLAADGYRMKDCLQFVIQSPIFLEK